MYELFSLERCMKNDLSQTELLNLKKKKYKQMEDELEEMISGIAYLEGPEVKEEQKNHHLHPKDCVCLVANKKFIKQAKKEIELRFAELKVLQMELESLF